MNYPLALELFTVFLYTVGIAPRVIESLVRNIQEDRITERPRAWLEARFGDRSLLVYFSRCFRCMCHWVGVLVALFTGTILLWFGLPWQMIPIMLIFVPASVSLAEDIYYEKKRPPE